MADRHQMPETQAGIIADLTRLVGSVYASTGTHPSAGGFAFLLSHQAGRHFRTVVGGLLTARLASPAGSWEPPEGVRGRLLGWLHGVPILVRDDVPPKLHYLMSIDDLRTVDAGRI